MREAGFRYADYSFGMDYKDRSGVYGDDCVRYFDKLLAQAERIGIKLVQAHSPMGKPISDDNSAFLADTIRCVDACGAWGIPNLGEVHSGSIRLL